ncbi:MAG: Asp23/Gls24 family envelope stress response protein [Lactobacillaceae bacterium]|jgi:uncharacterized alkaline shock family protein YloU|nr:Asp23/Gls24 family envelope stress response protein [Lactobacillaceae bacterium]
MTLKMKTKNGTLSIDDDVIAIVVGSAASESFGVVGMASKTISDAANQVLNRPNFAKGITLKEDGDLLIVDVHIIVSYGTKLTEVSKSVKKQVIYALEKQLGIVIKKVNVIIEGVLA